MSEPSIRIHARAYRRGVVFIFSPCIIRVNSFSASLVFYSIFVPTRMRTRLDPSSLRCLPASYLGALPDIFIFEGPGVHPKLIWYRSRQTPQKVVHGKFKIPKMSKRRERNLSCEVGAVRQVLASSFQSSAQRVW